MRVLSIGNFSTGWDNSICDEEHIAKALEELGHIVHRWQRGEDIPQMMIQPDFTLIAQWDGYSDELLADLPHPLVYWAFDHQEQNQEWHCRLIAASDLYLSKRIEDKRFPNWQWLPQDFAPKFLDKISAPVQKDIEVLFTGSYLPWATSRTTILQAVDKQFDLHIYSVTSNEWKDKGFKNVHEAIMDEGLPELYARSKIVISIDHTIERGYWSDRVAQALCCGAFVLHHWQPMAEIAFKNHVAYFYNEEDCLEKLENLLRPDIIPIREEYAQRGYEYAQQNLKVKNRVMDLLTIVGSLLV